MPKLGYPVHGVGEAEYLSPSFHPSQSQAPPCPGKSPRCREAPVRGEVGPFPPAPLTLSSPQWTPWPTWLSCSVNISWSEHCIAWPSPAPAPDQPMGTGECPSAPRRARSPTPGQWSLGEATSRDPCRWPEPGHRGLSFPTSPAGAGRALRSQEARLCRGGR